MHPQRQQETVSDTPTVQIITDQSYYSLSDSTVTGKVTIKNLPTERGMLFFSEV